MRTKPLAPGDPAPDFDLSSDTGKNIRLSDFRGKRVILYFYPRDDTPGCTAQACGFRDRYPQITEQNAVVLGISPDGVDSHRAFKTKYNLPFILLADPDHRVAEAYGVWNPKTLLPGINRSHFVIDTEGRLEDIQVKINPADSVERAVKSVGASG